MATTTLSDFYEYELSGQQDQMRREGRVMVNVDDECIYVVGEDWRGWR